MQANTSPTYSRSNAWGAPFRALRRGVKNCGSFLRDMLDRLKNQSASMSPPPGADISPKDYMQLLNEAYAAYGLTIVQSPFKYKDGDVHFVYANRFVDASNNSETRHLGEMSIHRDANGNVRQVRISASNPETFKNMFKATLKASHAALQQKNTQQGLTGENGWGMSMDTPSSEMAAYARQAISELQKENPGKYSNVLLNGEHLNPQQEGSTQSQQQRSGTSQEQARGPAQQGTSQSQQTNAGQTPGKTQAQKATPRSAEQIAKQGPKKALGYSLNKPS
jgi:hypothetical protein